MTEMSIRPAETAADMEAVRKLCWDYRDFLRERSEVDRQITEMSYPEAKYAQLLSDLPKIHAPPRGLILLVENADGAVLGCGMLHGLDTDRAEIKRVYIAPQARGHGLARRLCTGLVEHARAQGFATVLLDTSKSLTAAQSLYTGLGFRARGPYQDVPANIFPHLLFYELPLGKES